MLDRYWWDIPPRKMSRNYNFQGTEFLNQTRIYLIFDSRLSTVEQELILKMKYFPSHTHTSGDYTLQNCHRKCNTYTYQSFENSYPSLTGMPAI